MVNGSLAGVTLVGALAPEPQNAGTCDACIADSSGSRAGVTDGDVTDNDVLVDLDM